MITLTHTPTPNKYMEGGTYEKQWVIIGDTIEELVEETLKYIRPQSREFYRKSIREDLEKNKDYAYVDVHAGQGLEFEIRLRKPCLVDKNNVPVEPKHWAMYISHIYGVQERMALIEEVTKDVAKVRIFSFSEKYSQVEEFNQAKLYKYIEQLSEATDSQIEKQFSYLVHSK